MDSLKTAITRMLGIRYPIVAAPMFLVSNRPLLEAVARAGGIGLIPTLNFRQHSDYRRFLAGWPQELPFGVNIILRHNPRLAEDLQATIEHRVPLVVTSLGDPTPVIEAVHDYGGKVWCDVVNLKHARKAAAAGADALVAVASGAGGHAGAVSPFVLAPWLRRETGLPVLVAGGISTGEQMLAALALGDGVYVGTRFIATKESGASEEYKQALVAAAPDEIVYTPEVTGVPANFLRSSLARLGQEGVRPWKDVWSAGHGVGLIEKVVRAKEVIEGMVSEYYAAKRRLP